jgi:hypothetical protein
MADRTESMATITNRRPGTIELFELDLKVSEAEARELEKNPETFLWKALESAGQKVNAVIIGNPERTHLVERTHRIQPTDDKIKTVVAHIVLPADQESKHIVVTLPV